MTNNLEYTKLFYNFAQPNVCLTKKLQIMGKEILFKNEVCEYLRLPDIPKKEWDGKGAFEKGVAIIDTMDGDDAYVVAAFDPNRHSKPNVIKVFSGTPFGRIKKIFPIPSYMDVDDVEKMDLDEQSKKRAKEVVNEAKEIETNDEKVDDTYDDLPEWVFPEIHNIEEASAWLAAYRKKNKIRGKLPTGEETIKACLLAAYADINSK